MQTTVAAAAAVQDREEEAPEFPPPPAYYRLFAPPPASATATAEDGMAATAAAASAGGEEQEEEREEEAGKEEGSFPLPPPALPRRGQRVEMFGFPLAFLDEEHYDPIVAPEARLYPVTEAVTHDNDGGAAGSNAGEGARVAVVELDYRKELKRLHGLLTETILALFSALCTTDLTSTAEQQQRPHLELLGKAVQLVDNMHDALSAYRQHQTLVQLVERMEVQCQEKRAVIQRLRSQIAESRQAADGASTGLVAALTALVGGGEDDGMVS